MSNAWLDIPLEDYEGHMGAPGVQQIPVLSDIFRGVLQRYCPKTVAVLGVAGGNGLEHVDSAVTKRVVGVDINPNYLEHVRKRFAMLAGLELHCCDLNTEELRVAQVDLVHAALIFEHAGVDRALENAVALVSPGGIFSVVLQLPSATEQAVAPTNFASIQKVKDDFAFVDVEQLQGRMAQKRFQLVEQELRPVPAGKTFWCGTFRRFSGGE